MAEKLTRTSGEEEYDRLEIERRKEVVDEWRGAAEAVALGSGMDLAAEMVDFLNTRTGLGAFDPLDASVKGFYDTEQGLGVDNYAFITPILTTDNRHMTKYIASRSGSKEPLARFDGGSRCIFLRENVYLGRIGKGLTLLHETVHAIIEIEGLINSTLYPQHYWLEEAEAYQVEYQILAGFAGKPYTDLVNRIQREEDGIRNRYEFDAADWEVLREIFGQHISEDELNNWRFFTYEHAFLEHLKQHDPRPVVKYAEHLAWQAESRKDSNE